MHTMMLDYRKLLVLLLLLLILLLVVLVLMLRLLMVAAAVAKCEFPWISVTFPVINGDVQVAPTLPASEMVFADPNLHRLLSARRWE